MRNQVVSVASAVLMATGGIAAYGQEAGQLAPILSGTVSETLAGGRYSYLNVDTGTGLLWVACVQVEAGEGDPVRVDEGRLMTDFTSPTLHRTFERIIFASRLQVGTNSTAGRTLPAGHPPVTGQGTKSKATGTLPPGHPPMSPGGMRDGGGAGQEVLIRGEVVEVMDAGGYTYVQVKTPAGLEWVAGNKFKVAVGERVVMSSGMVMRNFESPTLNRKFEALRFVDSIRVDDGKGRDPRLPAGHP